MKINRRQTLCLIGAMGIAPRALFAQGTWPVRPIKLTVGYSAGGGTDAVARIYAQHLSTRLGQQVLVENRPGGTGSIGAASIARSEPDGYSLLIGTPSEMVSFGTIGQQLPYKAFDDFTSVVRVGVTPVLIAAHPSVMTGSAKDFFDQARTSKKTYSYATPGTGTPMHFVGEALKLATQVDFLHVPYKGAAPATTDALGHQVDFVIAGLPPLIPHVQKGGLKALAITSNERSPLLPDVPTINEVLGINDFAFSNWMTVYGPKNLPAPIIDALSAAVQEIARDPAISESLIKAGVDPKPLQGAQLIDFQNREITRYQRVAQQAGIKISP